MVIPVHDVNPVRRTPVVTYALIAANVLVFLFMPGLSGSMAGDSSLAQLCHLQAFLDHYAAVPRELIHHQLPQLVPTGDVARRAGCGLCGGPAGLRQVARAVAC